MTRKQALNKAIEALSKDKEYTEVISKLKDIYDELPLIHWSDKSIRDTVDQFFADNGRVPTVSDFRRKGMPPHTVIKQKYKITLSEWLSENYPTHRPTYEELKEKYTKEFVEEYERIKPKTQDQFNKERTCGTKGWQTVASYYSVKSWKQLLNVLSLPPYSEDKHSRKHGKIKVCIYSHYDFTD